MKTALCPLCGRTSTRPVLDEVEWLAPALVERLLGANPRWRQRDGACPACVQQLLLESLLQGGEVVLHERIQAVWPLDAEAAFGALPTPLRMHADPRYTGRGQTLALIDSGFYPHPDLMRPLNRIRAWVDVGTTTPHVLRFGANDVPQWPRWGAGDGPQWHGLMTSAVAAGNGWLSHGFYRGMAPDAAVVLIQVREPSGHIGNAAIARALEWLLVHGRQLGVGVVSLSVSGDVTEPLAGNPVDMAVAALVDANITVIAAAGNDGVRHLVPPATAPGALTVGGLDDMNTFDHAARALWHSNYGAAGSLGKPEVVAPSIWVVAPLLPATDAATEAAALFARRAGGDAHAEPLIEARKLVTPHYQHVDGTSFAAPLVAGIVACMREADPALTPQRVRAVLVASAEPVAGASLERQGAGAVHAAYAIAGVLAKT
ncbi:MAG: S8 family serine peptidase [Luteimonas sp.]|nr:S8 family serine peptidase [Luteimonas sp.]